MRIGMVTLCYRPVTNGVVRMIDLYRAHLERRGHKVTIFTFGSPPGPGEEDTAVTLSPGLSLLNSGYYANWQLNKRARRRMGEMDILHAHHLFLTIRLAQRYGNCPVVYTNHTRYDLYIESMLPLGKVWSKPFMKRAWPDACAMANAVIAPSASVAEVLNRFGVSDRVELIENGIDQRPFRHPPYPFSKSELGLRKTAVLLIYVGRLSKEKNVDVLLEQFATLSNLQTDAALLIVGDGPERRRLAQLAETLKISDRVRFTGRVAQDTVPNYLAAADIFITASESEVHPLALIEAMSAGLPIVAPAAPGNSDIVEDGVTGLLAKQNETLAEAARSLVNHAERRQQMAHNARQRSTRYDIGRTVEKTVALYERLRYEQPLANGGPARQLSRRGGFLGIGGSV